MAAYGHRRRGARAGPSRHLGCRAARRSGSGCAARRRARESPQDRPDPRTGMGGSAEGPHRRAPRRRHRTVVCRGRGQPLRCRRDGDGCGAGGRARRPADHQRRQARRGRAHRQVRLGSLGGAMARRARDHGRADPGRRGRARPARRRSGQRCSPARAGDGPSRRRLGGSRARRRPSRCGARCGGTGAAPRAVRRAARAPPGPAGADGRRRSRLGRLPAGGGDDAAGGRGARHARQRLGRPEGGPRGGWSRHAAVVRCERHLHRGTRRRACCPVRSGQR